MEKIDVEQAKKMLEKAYSNSANNSVVIISEDLQSFLIRCDVKGLLSTIGAFCEFIQEQTGKDIRPDMLKYLEDLFKSKTDSAKFDLKSKFKGE